MTLGSFKTSYQALLLDFEKAEHQSFRDMLDAVAKVLRLRNFAGLT